LKKIDKEKNRVLKKFKTKSFKKLMEKRLTKSEIAEIELKAQIEYQAMLEAKYIKSL
jgi:hypothetical protein